MRQLKVPCLGVFGLLQSDSSTLCREPFTVRGAFASRARVVLVKGVPEKQGSKDQPIR